MFKLTDAHKALIRERKSAGLSLRTIAQWLEVTEGVKVSPQAIKNVLDAEPRAPRATTPAPKRSIPAQNVATEAAKSTEEAPEIGDSAEGDAADYALISKIIEDLEADIQAARDAPNPQGQATLERLRLDALKRRRDLRPPAPPSEVDAELVDAGRRAIAKLEALLEAHIAGRAA